MHTRICLIPLDSRPVCAQLPQQLGAIAGLEVAVPSAKLLGHLKKPANFAALDRWVKNHLFENDPVIVALDTIAYGGLIPARVGDESIDELEKRTQQFFDRVRAADLYGFSSIMRIPNYNNAEEEPDYWATHGKQLYEYSEACHRQGGLAPDPEGIPTDVLEDFLVRRKRNFTLNMAHLYHLALGRLDYLTFCQDDTGSHGLNVKEAQDLDAEIQRHKVSDSCHIQTGADEVAACMLTRWMLQNQDNSDDHPPIVKIYPYYTTETGSNTTARFDGIPISSVVHQQIKACGAHLADTPEEASAWLLVHTPETEQLDHCERRNMRTFNLAQPSAGIQHAFSILEQAKAQNKPLMLADVAYANGGDPALITPLLNDDDTLPDLYSYAGWNTPGNTVGTSLAMGICRYLAEQNNRFNAEEFKKLLLIRLCDDWLYQSDVRYYIRQQTNGKLPDVGMLNAAMANGIDLIKSKIDLEEAHVSCRFPCQRSFEVEILVQTNKTQTDKVQAS
ncbi:MAG: DUF4127 family protein [Vampirovibrio sp.]|nr:DUF4127 family protein [Vampirovibrio sp.]